MTDVRHDRHRTGFPVPDESLRHILELADAQPVIARIAANVDPDYPRRLEHVELVATVAMRAKVRPANAFAKATVTLP